ncbi:ABC transporter ATP-binding protein [Streptomyces sp. NPDC093586]|uniref:ABC transporter ATP-binding protein n=1 Tax=Streptomyces sp. NPDC093586 TaxID=3366042 RepID=UPI0038272476
MNNGRHAEEPAIEAYGLGRKYRRGWALRDCSFRLPAGRICGLVGPNGAGKTTLMGIAAHMLEPTQGTLRLFGTAPGSAEAVRRTAFLAQEKPLYRHFTVAEHLRLGRELNPAWDQRAAEDLVRAGDIPLDAKTGTLSGGQRTRVAFAVAFGKRPDLLLLDEPMADLDPVVRQELMATVLAEAAEHGTTVLMSTHVLAELDDMCDFLVVVSGGTVRLAGDVSELLALHTVITGPADDGAAVPDALRRYTVIESRAAGGQFSALLRSDTPVTGPWQTSAPGVEDLLLAYLRSAQAPPLLTSTAQVPHRTHGVGAVAA